ncbi:hypothetical protein ABEB36_001697 [Hypothenemus hampei]|uniref:Putative hydroxypyruvate isomerase n=1 Tax=Hypothenemus hampei TaxID=57062 RepID=A0ABD1FFF7_HYPHA
MVKKLIFQIHIYKEHARIEVRISVTVTNHSSMAKFCANLSFLFNEVPFLQRYAAAKSAGFQGVESGFPYGFSKEQVVQAKNAAGIEQILLNTLTGDVKKGELGYAAIPGKQQQFHETFQTTLDYARGLGVKKIHIMSGTELGEVTEAHHKTYVENLKYAATLLEKEGILGVIEPINKYSIPKYYMNSYERAIEVLKEVNSSSLKLQLDIFHLQLIKGNITHTIQEVQPFIGHVQIAQAPNRNEPNIAGEIDYRYVLEIIKNEANYADWIGLEYSPERDTVKGLEWIQNFGYNL